MGQKLLSAFRWVFIHIKNRSVLSIGKNTFVGIGAATSAIYNLEIIDNVYIGKNVKIEVEDGIESNCLFGISLLIFGSR